MKEKLNNLFKINKKTIFKVIIFHFAIILILALHINKKKISKKKALTINQITLAPKIEPKTIALKKPIIKNQPKPSKQKKIEPKVSNTSKQNLEKTKEPRQYENLINKLEKQIKNLEKPSLEIKKNQDLKIPQKKLIIPKITEETIDTASDLDDKEMLFKEFLVKKMQENLKLPEYGEVKISFIIHPNGQITDIEILDYQSFKNQSYLKNKLNDLSLDNINNKITSSKKFVVVFKNE